MKNFIIIDMKNQYIEPVSNLAHTMYVINLNIKILNEWSCETWKRK